MVRLPAGRCRSEKDKVNATSKNVDRFLPWSIVGSTDNGMQEEGCCRPTPPPPPVEQKAESPAPKAPTASLVAEPGTIERGQWATLKWSSTDATEVQVSGLGQVAATGSRDVQPVESTIYRLIAKGPGGSAYAAANVNVTVPPPPSVTPRAETRTLRERIDTELVDVYFDFDKSNIREDGRDALARDAHALRSILADFPDAVVILEGHCDERGSAEYNLGLGDRRAVSTHAFLEALGVTAGRLKMISYGKERPQCTESTEECWQKNRRVHFAAGAN